MGDYTSTQMALPTCENCGGDKQATYICDPCCDKLNAITRATRTERDRLAAENAELKQRLTRSIIAADLAAANATLDRLRVVAYPDGAVLTASQVCDKYFATQAILYPPETPNEKR